MLPFHFRPWVGCYNGSKKVEGTRSFLLVLAALMLIGFVLFGGADTRTSVAYTNPPDNEATNSVREAGNRAASATISITMYAAADD
jgi:hypothetical protein